jgi:magnesium chelatase family protein
MTFAICKASANNARSPRAFILPAANADEAALVSDATIYPAHSLLQVCAHFAAVNVEDKINRHIVRAAPVRPVYADFSDVKGQLQAKRALEIAAAGMHSVIMVGPPGTGKSMLAARFAGILPTMTDQEAPVDLTSKNGRFAPTETRITQHLGWLWLAAVAHHAQVKFH